MGEECSLEGLDPKDFEHILTTSRREKVSVSVRRCSSPLASRLGLQQPQNLVVFKTIPRSLVTGDEAAARRAAYELMKEKAALKAVRGCVGVSKLLGTAKDDCELHFVLEPLLGGALHKHIRVEEGGLPSGRAAFYAAEIASALACMHSKGVSHRDIKASNVCFDWFGHVKLVDLGSAKPGLQGPLDIMHTVCGTPHSMAPEVVRCREHDAAGYTMSADWWSFGILVYEMLMGEPPFGYGGGGSQEREALFTSILEHDPGGCPLPRPSDELAINLIGSLLHSDPHARLVSDNVLEDVWLQSACGRDKWGDLKSHSIEAPYFRQDLGELEEEWPGAAPEHNLEAFGTDLWTGF